MPGVDDVRAVDLLTRAVTTPSLSGQEARVAALLVGAATGAREAFIDAAGNAVARWGRGPVHVMFVGHMDTVGGHVPVRVRDGVLYGRGTVDAKGSLCAALVAGARLSEAVLGRVTFTVVGAVEEEAPSSKGAHHLLRSQPRPDALIIGEPSGWQRYTLGYKGQLSATVTVRRDAAHSSRDESTAAELVVTAYNDLKSWVDDDNRGVDGLFDRLQLALLSLESRSDGTEDVCAARVGLRLPVRWGHGDLARAVAGRVQASVPGAQVDLGRGLDAVKMDSRSGLARAFRVAVRAHAGTPTPTLKTGTSDMNVLAPVWNVPTVAYGPGDSNLDHTPDEHIELDEYLRSVAVLERVLLELARA